MASGFADLGKLEKNEMAEFLNRFPEDAVFAVSEPDFMSPLAEIIPLLMNHRRIYDVGTGNYLNFWKNDNELVQSPDQRRTVTDDILAEEFQKASADGPVFYLTYPNHCQTATSDELTYQEDWKRQEGELPITIHIKTINDDGQTEINDYNLLLQIFQVDG